MNEQRDPLLETIFADSVEDLVDENFTSISVDRVNSRRRHLLIGRLTIVALLLVLELLLGSPLQNSVGAINELLDTSLIKTDDNWLAFTLAPINSIASIIGVTLLGLHFIFRKFLY